MKIIISALFATLAACTAYANESEGPAGGVSAEIAENDMKILCGVNSAYLALRMLGNDVNFYGVYSKLIDSESSTVSLADIERVLNGYGADAKAVFICGKDLSRYAGEIFIVHSMPQENGVGHFHVMRVLDENTVQIIDPPNQPKTVKISGLNGGKMAVVATGNFTPHKSRASIFAFAAVFSVGVAILVFARIRKHA